MYKCNIKGKVYRLMYKLNENTQIQVNTPVVMSEKEDVGESVGQGTVEGAVISAVNLDSGVRDFFRNSVDEVNYFGLELAPLLFQDDVARLASSVSSAQSGNDRMDCVAASKLLQLHKDKSCFTVFGSKKAKQHISQELG